MGKKGYNWRARSAPQIEIETKSTKKIAIDIDHGKETYDECNTLVLPSKKRRTIKRDKKSQSVKLLSKKHRKHLEKVLERKEKKVRRATLLEGLAQVQATPEELKQYVSITSVQTKGLKRQREEDESSQRPKHLENTDNDDETEETINAIRGSKKQRLQALSEESSSQGASDPNVVGYEESASEDEVSSEENEESDKEDDEETSGVPQVVENSRESSSRAPGDTATGIAPKSPEKSEKPLDRKPAVFVALNRLPEIQKARLKLPVLAEEQMIVEAINDNPVVIITGETGSGKTTQVPQFLYEAGYARSKIIGVTEPRRVAAISMSKRVAEEMNLPTSEVSYLIRFEGNTTDDTRIKFMTDGVLLKEVQSDFLLSKYSVIILDEAHERSVYTDILIGLLSRIVPMRARRNDPLKLIVMSATLRVEDFVENSRLFKVKPPLVRVESRQFPVTIHFNRRTSHNYVVDCIKKAVKIHTTLPEGGILIFLTGQQEVNTVVRRLRKAFPHRKRAWEKGNKGEGSGKENGNRHRSEEKEFADGDANEDSGDGAELKTRKVLEEKKKRGKCGNGGDEGINPEKSSKLPKNGEDVKSKKSSIFKKKHSTGDEDDSENSGDGTELNPKKVLKQKKKKKKSRNEVEEGMNPGKSSKLSNTEEDEEDVNSKIETSEEGTDSDEDFHPKTALSRLRHKLKSLPKDLPTINLDNYSATPTDDTQEDLFSEDDDDPDVQLDEDEEDDDFVLELHDVSTSQPLWVLPLYSLLPAHKQVRVFQKVPEGCRLCVVSTNVAETSLTIPNIKYVVDSGRCKTRMYDKVTGVSTFKVTYTSQAGANQRAGRAGRMGPGHCYRLYSSAVFNDQFEKFSVPEIQRKPVDDLVLQMKVMNIVKVVNFPFPSPPDATQLITAEKRLRILGALEDHPTNVKDYSAKVTKLGRSISAFPVAPRFGKMLAISQQENLLKFTICMVSALSVQELLIDGRIGKNMEGSEDKTPAKKWQQTRRFWAGTGNSLLLGDPMVLIRAIGAAEYSEASGGLPKFCADNGLRPKAIAEVKKLRHQLTNEISLNIPSLQVVIDPNMSPPTDTEAKQLRQIVLAGMADQVARKMSPDEIKEEEDKSKFRFAYKTMEMEEPVFMHLNCVLRRSAPEWVVYQEIYETNKIYMRGVTAIEPEWLPKFVPGLCRMGEPMVDPAPRWDDESGKVMCHLSGSFGRAGWELPAMEVEFPAGVEGVRWFARFLLEGKVCGKLKRFVKVLLSNPSSVNKSWAKLLPRTEGLTRSLLGRGIMSRERLLEVWGEDRGFLLESYKKWVPEAAHAEVCAMWPPV
ncbi:probable ATP-dependent RNA helicase kurz [Diachasma alloeum]|uniref:probable ATP-dependent RNA helicase kurz n=1 Tax=Diachasma alloeum TaxID=454923 RepID=UPI0007384BAD|nr:probable ATP-dependent RNA helicase kurz [Diachasma alloeum]